jgi:hypothetical protein
MKLVQVKIVMLVQVEKRCDKKRNVESHIQDTSFWGTFYFPNVVMVELHQWKCSV